MLFAFFCIHMRLLIINLEVNMKKIVVLLSSLIFFSTGINAETLRILAEAGDEATLTKAAAQFEAANPGVTIEASYLGWDDFMATIKLKLADNNPPDLAHGNQGFTVDGTLIQNGLVIFIDTFGDINALDLKTGSLMWQAQTIKEDIFENAFLLKSSRLVYDNQTIFISNNQNNFFAIDSRNGSIRWEQTINSYLEPSIIENIVLTISEEGYLFVIDKKNGNILRSTNILNTIKNKNEV